MSTYHNTKMKCAVAVLFIIAQSNFLKYAAGEHFEDPPFLEMDPPDLENRTYFGEVAFDTQVIFLEEAIKEPISIARINCKESSEPTIKNFCCGGGNNSTLGAILQKINSKWLLTITKTQDFDRVDMKNYFFDIVIEDESHSIALTIINIDNKSPIIEHENSTCSFNENEIGPTGCFFHISDEDGWIDKLEYEIIGNNKEDELFKIKKHPISGTSYDTRIELEVVEMLDFETISLHIFTLKAIDTGKNEASTTVVLKVNDMPDEPPTWQKIFSAQTIDEKSSQTYLINAIDGDREVQDEINYRLIDANVSIFHIDEKTGLLTVNSIDRDELKKDMFEFLVEAYEVNPPSDYVNSSIIFIVNDINDHGPEISFDSEEPLLIAEGQYLTLERQIRVIDIDSGINAAFTVSLEDDIESKFKWFEAFKIIPDKGFEDADFTVSIIDAEKLDYENPDWRKMTLKVVATDTNVSTGFYDSKNLVIELMNLNDEEPIFTNDEDKIVEIEETAKAGVLIETMEAIDLDVDDTVEYSLIGSINQILQININTGEIRTKNNDVFDYETRPEVIVQIKAKDTLVDFKNSPLHSTIFTLNIKIIDVNDETPVLYMPTERVSIAENGTENTEVVKINAFDPDTAAVLHFEIDWKNTRATKQGQDVDLELFEGCFEITTTYNNDFKGNATGTIKVKKNSESETLDFEKYEFMYLMIKVTDTNQTINTNTNSATLPIIIEDINDNEPVFNKDISDFKVKDKAGKNTVIGFVLATDNDGPNFNKITYLIKPINNTNDGLIEINSKRGELSVKNDNVINCDFENNYPVYLYYEIIATDCDLETEKIDPCYKTPLEIAIYIEDINDKYPSGIPEKNEVHVLENTNILNNLNVIIGFDADRDEPFNVINYYINNKDYPELQNYFGVDEETGIVYVDVNNGELDRETTSNYIISILLFDKTDEFGNRNRNDTYFTVIIDDVNDEAPIFDEISIFPNARETYKKGIKIADIHATDADDPTTDNNKINYILIKVWKDGIDNSDYTDYFEVTTDKNWEYGNVATHKALKGLYGKFWFTIMAKDRGDPPLNTTKNFELSIEKFNYENPDIIFPKEDDGFVLSKSQQPNSTLFQTNGEPLGLFQANDGFNGDKWKIEFSLELDYGIFNLVEKGTNIRELQVTNTNNLKIKYELKLITKINADEPSDDKVSFIVYFVDQSSDPIFETDKTIGEIHENTTGITETVPFLEAKDELSGIPGVDETIYYFIQGESNEFELINSTTNELKLKDGIILDREAVTFYLITIITSHKSSVPSNPGQDSQLKINITVLDVNDNPPIFELPMIKGITTTNKIDDVILTIKANDLDDNDEITYHLLDVKQFGDKLNVPGDPFSLNTVNGEIQLKFRVQSDMVGYFELTVEARDSEYSNDPENHFDRQIAKIYIVSDVNRVLFEFNNEYEEVDEKSLDVQDIFSDIFKSDCSIDAIEKVYENNVPVKSRTKVTTYFIKDDAAVPAEEIKIMANRDDVYSEMSKRLAEQGLSLKNVDRIDNGETQNLEQLLQTILIVVSAVLGTLCIVLFAAFFLRTRSLNKRLEALSNTQFGSNESNMNRIGMPAPNTNLHAIEGSNPVWQEDMKPDIDAVSTGSGDSDMIGIENNPEFAYEDGRRASFNPVMHNDLGRGSLNPVAQGSPTMFKPAFLD